MGKTLKERFQLQLADEEKSFAVDKDTTLICEGTGCEPDKAKRMQYQNEWRMIEERHDAEKSRLQGLLAQIEEIIAEPPFRRCPEFEGYLADKAQLARGKELLSSL